MAGGGPPTIDCPAATHAIEIDGRLDDWESEGALFVPLVRADASLPARDASAELALRFDEDALYLALKLTDDRVVADAPNFWDADGIDLYLETSSSGPGAPDASRALLRHRVTLLPFNQGRRFGVITWANRRVLGPGGLNGVDVAAQEVAESSGAYHVEARIPLRAFGIIPAQERELGFEVAFRDRDGTESSEGESELAERATLSASGRADLSAAAGPLPRLRFLGDPAAIAPGVRAATAKSRGWGVAAALLVLALLWGIGKSAKRVQRVVQPRFPRWRTVGLLAIALVALILGGGVDALERFATWRAESTLRRRGETLRAALAELSTAEVAARLRGADDAALRELLAGRALQIAEANRFEQIDVVPAGTAGPGEFRSLEPVSGVPFREYGARIGGPRGAPDSAPSLDVVLERPERARRVHVALAAFLPRESRDDQIVNGVEVQLQFVNRTAQAAARNSFTIDDARGEPFVGHDRRTWGKARLKAAARDEPWLAAEVAGMEVRHVDHFVWDLPPVEGAAGDAPREPLISRITILPTPAAGESTLFVSAITLERGSATPEFVPIAFGSSDRNGFPMAMRRGRPAPRELRIPVKPGKEPTTAVLWGREGEPPLDLLRLRLYYRAEGPVLRALADPARLGVLSVRARVFVTLEGREKPLEFPLRAGLEIDDSQIDELQHPASMTSFLASTYETRQGLQHYEHYDGYELPLPAVAAGAPPLRVRKIEIEQPSDARGALIVAGATALVRDEPPPPPKLKLLVFEGASLALAPSVVAALQGDGLELGFAVARDGVITQSGGALDPDVGERLRGTGLAASARAADELVVRHEERAGRSFLTLPLECAFGGGSLRVLLLGERPTLAKLRSARDGVALAAGLLSLPFVLLLLVDGLSRIARIRTRLSFLFLLTSLAPLMVLFAVLANVLAGEQRRAEERRAEELLSQVRERAARLGDLAAEHALRTLKELEDVVAAPVNDEQVRLRLARMAQSFPDRDATIAIVAETIGEGGAVRRIHSSALAAADPRFDAASEGLALAWGGVVFTGSATGRRALKVRVAGWLDAPALKPLRMSPEEGESVALLAPPIRRRGEEFPGGEPLARSALGGGVEAGEARAAAHELDAGRGSFFRSRDGGGTSGFELLRGTGSEPVAIVAASIGARPVRVDLGIAAVELPWFLLALGAVILAASHFLGSVVTDGITRPLARLLRGAVEHAAVAGVARETAGAVRDDSEDEIASLETSFRRLSDEVARRGRQQSTLIELAASMAQPGGVAERAWRGLEGLHQVVGGSALACFVFDPAADAFVLAAQRAEGPASAFPSRLPAASPGLAELLADRRPRLLAPSSGDEAASLRGDAKACAILPLLRTSRPLGFVIVRFATGEDPLASLDPAYVAGVLGQIAGGLESARLETRTIEDPETGLFVHAHFASRVAEEIDRAAHTSRPLALLMVRARLPAAEASSREAQRRVAAAIARELRRSCRERELLAHAGALEFEVLAPYGDRARAEEIVRDLRQRLADPQALGADAGIRTDAAIACFPGDARSADFLFAALRRRLDSPTEHEADDAAGEAIERFRTRFPEFGFGSPRMQPMLRQLEKVAPSDATVLVLGETGSGKEVVAQLLHRLSARAQMPFIAVHCAALPEKLLESELFGYEKGAFTGADARRLGRFEQANGGTLFLDEVAEIPLSVQVKLLRVLQERKVQRLGAGDEIPVDVRLIAATHQSLERRVADGSFREDLYYRLKVVSLELPPLRERMDEIPALVDRFLAARRASDPTCRVRGVEPAALDVLARHHWPGNVRELRNVIERAVVLGDGDVVRKEDIAFTGPPDRTAAPAAAAAERTGPGNGGPHFSATAVARPGSGPPTGMTERQRQIVALVRERGTLTSREYCILAKVSQRTALRDLSELVERGFLIRSGSRRGAIYRATSIDEPAATA
jgi:DNA-binding NtrC family response regulator